MGVGQEETFSRTVPLTFMFPPYPGPAAHFRNVETWGEGDMD